MHTINQPELALRLMRNAAHRIHTFVRERFAIIESAADKREYARLGAERERAERLFKRHTAHMTWHEVEYMKKRKDLCR